MFFKKKAILRLKEDDTLVNLKNKNLHVIIEGEKILVKVFRIPKMRKKLIPSTVHNELGYTLMNFKEIIYSYSIICEEEDYIEVQALCVNSHKLNCLKSYSSKKNSIISVELIQFYFLNYFKNHIKEKDYIFTLSFNGVYYFMLCLNNYMDVNEVVIKKVEENKSLNSLFFQKSFANFMENYWEQAKNIKKMYMGNIPKDERELYNGSIEIEYLGEINELEMLNYKTLKKKGRYAEI